MPRIVSVDDSTFTLPPVVKVANVNLPAHVQPAALATTIGEQVAEATAPLAPKRLLTGLYSFNDPGRLPIGKGVVGLGARNVAYLSEPGGGLRRSPDLGVSQYNTTVPATNNQTCTQVYEWNGYAYTVLHDSTDGSKKLYRANHQTTNLWDAMTWTPLLTLTPGTLGFGYTITGTANAIMVGEYGDPKIGGVNSAHIWRSTDGVNFTAAKTFPSFYRHVHCVVADPFNPGHVWASGGDNITGHLSYSTDHGATWTDLPLVQGWQMTQLSFTEDWIYAAPDPGQITGSLFLIDRATKTPRVGSLGSHRDLPIRNPGYYTDGSTTSGSTTFTDTRGGMFTAADVGRRVVSTNIPAGTTIASYTNASTVVLSAAATATGTPATWQIERPERPVVNCFHGAVDPATGIYYGAANDDAGAPSNTAFGRRILFAIPYPGGPIIYLGAVSAGDAVFIGQGKVWFGNFYLTLLGSDYAA